MDKNFVMHNSIWRNLVVGLLCAFFFFGSIFLMGLSAIIHDQWMLVGFALFGFGTFSFGYCLFDRRAKVIVNNTGVVDFRNGYGLIPWAEISEFNMWSVKGSYFVTLKLRDPTKWIAKAGVWTKAIAHVMGPKRFAITVGLQNMAVDESELRSFMSEMVSRGAVHA